MSMALNTSIEPQFRTIDGLKIRFAESEQRDEHALLLSPWLPHTRPSRAERSAKSSSPSGADQQAGSFVGLTPTDGVAPLTLLLERS